MEILPVKTQEEAVEQGAKLLDHYRPGWEKTVHGAMSEGVFAMDCWDTCMAGTLELITYPNYEPLITFNGFGIHGNSVEAEYIGFVPMGAWGYDFSRADWDTLDALWRAQVEKRISVEGEQQ